MTKKALFVKKHSVKGVFRFLIKEHAFLQNRVKNIWIFIWWEKIPHIRKINILINIVQPILFAVLCDFL